MFLKEKDINSPSRRFGTGDEKLKKTSTLWWLSLSKQRVESFVDMTMYINNKSTV